MAYTRQCSGGGERQADSESTLMVESLKFDDRQVLGYDRKTGVKNSSQDFSQKIGKDGGTLAELRKITMEDGVGWMRNLEFRAVSGLENKQHLISIKSHETGWDQVGREYRKRKATQEPSPGKSNI